ncbi:MAG: 2-dehydropantoate 2-reductase [Betaproteobacteria bacterium]|jgi:2-dehydropantoate 2-reductase|nr:2-dehydropantoate 2-reductase [Betaproteobacteria bacterium]
MKILVLGAGGVGGYFGGRLAQAGSDVTFLVRERRAAQLRADGLVVQTPDGEFRVPAQAVQRHEISAPFDLVLLTCKAYDLDSAIDTIQPAVGPDTVVVPLLNGLAHLDRLDAAFGAGRVIGGSCGIAATLTPEGVVKQMSPFHWMRFGDRSGKPRTQVQKLAAAYAGTPVDASAVPDILLVMWEKFVLLTTLAACTCMMRGSVGDVLATPDGEATMRELLDTCIDTAKAAGHAPRAESLTQTESLLFARGSSFSASMLRDIERGGPTEADHIVGDMLRRARSAGLDARLLAAAYTHLRVYEGHRAAAAS